jgi:hypothetical protein
MIAKHGGLIVAAGWTVLHAACIRHLIIQNLLILAIRNTIPMNRVKPVNCGSESASEKMGRKMHLR